MKNRKKYTIYLLIALFALIGLVLFINTFDPTSNINLLSITIPALIPFFILLFLVIASIFAFLFANSRRGVLVGLFAISFLILQFLHANSPFYTALLAIIAVLIELLFRKKK